MAFSTIIKQLRESKNLSQEEFANKLNAHAENSEGLYSSNFNKTNISKWENGKAEPRMDTVRLISETFDVSPNFLMEINPFEEKHQNNKSLRVAAHIDDDVTEKEMEDIIKYIKFLKSQHKD